MKPTSTFKLSKQTKRRLALGHFHGDQQRNQWRRAMIQAELHAAIQPKSSKSRGQRDDKAN